MSIGSRLRAFATIPGAAQLCAGLLGGAWLRATPSLIGAAPAALLGAGVATLVSLGVAGLLGPPRGARRVLLFLPALLLGGADPLLRGLGAARDVLALDQAGVDAILFLSVAASSLPALRRLQADPCRKGPLLAAVGLGLGLLLPATAGAALAGLGALVARAEPVAAAPRQRLASAVAAGLGAAAVSLGALGLRANLDPTPTPLLLGAVAALLGVWLGSKRGPRSAGAALLGGGILLAGTWGLLALAPAGTAALARLAPTAPGLPWSGLALLSGPVVLIGGVGGVALAQLGDRPLARGQLLGIGLGLAAGPALLAIGPTSVLWLAVALSGALLVGSGARLLQLASLGLLLLCAVAPLTLPSPDPALLAMGRAGHLQDAGALDRDAEVRGGLQSAWAGWAAGTSGAVRAPEQTVKAGETRAKEGGGAVSSTVEPVIVEIDGTLIEARSRAGDAEALAGHLAGMLAVDDADVLLLGDDAGRALRALSATPPRGVEVAVPVPAALRAVARLDAAAERAWLRPEVRLRAIGPALALRLTPRADAIVDCSRVPWADGAHAALDLSHLDAVAARLGPKGIYVAAIQLGDWPTGSPTAWVRAVARRFSTVQLWMPPSGADTLLVVASDTPLSLARLLKRATRAADALRTLGIQSPYDLAGLAIADRETALDWAGSDGQLPRAWALSPALFAHPVMHLATLAGHTAAPDALWDWTGVSDAPAAHAALTQRGRARELFLELLGKAAEGDLESVFQRAQTLLREAGSAGSDALDPLLEPHLKAARAALDRAQKEGLASKAWDEARGEAVTAQMLNPSSPAPYLIQGDLAFAQGNLTQGEDLYNDALTRDPTNITAMTGLARVKRMRGQAVAAEDLLHRATRVAPQTWSTWQNLGVFLMETGRADEASDALRKAAALDATQAAPHSALAELALDNQDPTRALVEVERALQLAPSGYAWYLRGRAHFDLEQLNQAEEDFRDAVLADPRLLEARGAIGHIQALRGDLEAAQDSFTAVLAQDPSNGPAREDLKMVQEALARRGPAPAPPAPPALPDRQR